MPDTSLGQLEAKLKNRKSKSAASLLEVIENYSDLGFVMIQSLLPQIRGLV